MMPADLARILRAAADECDRDSPLGARRHINAVRARVRDKCADAAIVGRRFLLSPEALREELANATGKKSKPEKFFADELREELGMPPERKRR